MSRYPSATPLILILLLFAPPSPAQKKDPGFRPARKTLAPLLARRRQFARAVRAELAARMTSPKKAPTAWAKARAAWKKAREGLPGGSPDRAAKELGHRIETHLQSIGRRFHLPLDSKKD